MILSRQQLYDCRGGETRVKSYLPPGAAQGAGADDLVDKAIASAEREARSLLGRDLPDDDTVRDYLALMAVFHLIDQAADRVPDERASRYETAKSWFRAARPGDVTIPEAPAGAPAPAAASAGVVPGPLHSSPSPACFLPVLPGRRIC